MVDRMSADGQFVLYQNIVTDVSLNNSFDFSTTYSFPFLSFRTIIQLKPEALLFRNGERREVFRKDSQSEEN